MKLRALEVSRPSRTVSEMERQAAAIAVSLVNCEKSGPPPQEKNEWDAPLTEILAAIVGRRIS
jgi:hypothetical protein